VLARRGASLSRQMRGSLEEETWGRFQQQQRHVDKSQSLSILQLLVIYPHV